MPVPLLRIVSGMRVKICGVTSLGDAEFAVEAGAWAIGLNNVPASPRRCDPDEAVRIGSALRRRVEVAGVFANSTLEEVEHAATEQHLTMIQLHGDEGPSFCTEIARRTGCPVIKAFRIRSNADIQAAEAFHTDYHLLDARSDAVLGGTGQTFDWELVKARRTDVPVILAGGLTPENVVDGIAAVHPYAVDVASGVEAEPGIKDPALVQAFIAAAQPEPAGDRT